MSTKKTVTPTALRKNVFHYLEQVNDNGPLEIQGRNSNQAGVLLSKVDYDKLVNNQVTNNATPTSVFVQKLMTLNEITDDKVLFQFGKAMITDMMNSSFQLQGDPMWLMTNRLLTTMICYVLRQMDQPINLDNLTKLSKLSFDDLYRLACVYQTNDDTDEAGKIYRKVINEIGESIQACAKTSATKQVMMTILSRCFA